MLAVVHFAHGSIAYTYQLEPDPTPSFSPYIQASSSIPEASNSPVEKRRVLNEVNRSLGQSIALSNGIDGSEWECLDLLWGTRESGWDNLRKNPTSTAFGIAQFLDSTWLGTGIQRSPDPTTQIKAGIIYIKNRYQTPCTAYHASLKQNWY